MKQFQLSLSSYYNINEEMKKLEKLVGKEKPDRLFFHISFINSGKEMISRVTEFLDKKFPDAPYYGNETFGNINEGLLSKEECIISCTIFENKDTKALVLPISKEEASGENPLKKLWDFGKKQKNLKAIEIVPSFSFAVSHNLKELSIDLPREVKVFGGVSVNIVNPAAPAYIIAKGQEMSLEDCVAILYCGSELFVECETVSGWKGLGKWVEVTKSSNSVIYEIDGAPAFDLYKKYLNMDLKSNVFANQSWFPLVIDKGGVEMIRSVTNVNKDSSLLTLLNVEEGTKVRLAYGDPSFILAEAFEKTSHISKFSPDIVKIFSCAARRLFWGDDSISQETEMLSEVSSAEGFYTAGELLRIEDTLYEFNSTIVLASMREGPITEEKKKRKLKNRRIESSLNARLVYFVTEVTHELEEQYKETYKALTNDTLTGIGNRYAYEAYWKDLHENDISKLVIVAGDVDGLKAVNDSMGHEAGDDLICGAAKVLDKTFGKVGKVFRTGGDEFIALIFTDNPDKIKKDCLKAMDSWKGKIVDKLHISIGMAAVKDYPMLRLEEIEKMADTKMYDEKNKYYLENHLDRRKR